MHHIVVQRAAGKSQTPGDCQGQLSIRAIGAIQANFSRRHLNRDGKAAVEVHVIEFRGLPVSPFESAAGRKPDGRGTVQVVPVGDEVVVVGISPGPRIDPLLTGNAKGFRLALRTQEQRGTLVHVAVRIHELGVRERNRAVGRRGDANLISGLRLPQPGMGILRGHRREARPEL